MPRGNGSARRPTLVLVLRVLSLACVAAAIAIVVTGGFSIAWGLLSLRVHRPMRLWLIGIALGAIAERLAGTTPPFRELLARLLTIGMHAIRLAIVAGGLAYGIAYATRIAGGADSSGYVSQAALLASGQLEKAIPAPPAAPPHAPVAAQSTTAAAAATAADKIAPWPATQRVWAPLGWRVGTTADSVVPTYAPGLSIAMAVARRVGGETGMWLVVPLLAALALWATGTLGRAIGGVPVMLWSPLLLVLSPVFINSMLQPMSDVAVAGWWTLAAALLARRRPPAIIVFGAGLAAAAAIATRPNLAPMALPFVWYLATADGVSWRAGFARVVTFGVGVLPGVLLIAWTNHRWYGSPFRSGYGSLSELFAPTYITTNLQRYAAWLIETHTPFILIGVAAPLVLWWTRRGQDRHARDLAWLCLGLVVMNALCYVAYTPFEHWTYLRFLLPAIPSMLMLSTVVLFEALRRLPWRLGIVAASLVCAGLAYRALTSDDLFVTRFAFTGETRYEAVAAYVAERLPPNAALISMQHSGSLHYYTGRTIVRWDWLEPKTIEPGSLDRACAALRARGLQPFLVIEDSEEAEFRARFDGETRRALDREPMVSTRLRPFVYIYDPTPRAAPPGTVPPRARVLP